ncbi:hypothetical protein, partial [Pseudomonas viridiflava]
QQGSVYALGNIAFQGLATKQASQVLNISGSIESGGTLTINAENFESRTLGGSSGNNFAVGRTLISGFIAVQTVEASRGRYVSNYIVRERFQGGQDSDVSASS